MPQIPLEEPELKFAKRQKAEDRKAMLFGQFLDRLEGKRT